MHVLPATERRGAAKRCLFAAAASMATGGIGLPLATSTPLKAIETCQRNDDTIGGRSPPFPLFDERDGGEMPWSWMSTEKAEKAKERAKQESEHVAALQLAEAESPHERHALAKRKKKKDNMQMKEEQDGQALDVFTTPVEKLKKAKKAKRAKRETADCEHSEGDGGAKPPLPYVVELGSRRRLTVDLFKGRIMVHVRQWYMDTDGGLRPGSKGLALTVSQWRIASANAAAVDKLLDDCGV